MYSPHHASDSTPETAAGVRPIDAFYGGLPLDDLYKPQAAAPAPKEEAKPIEPGKPYDPSYDEKLFAQLTRLANTPMPERAIDNVVSHYSGWSHSTEGVAEDRRRFLRRILSDPKVPVGRVFEDDERRTLRRTHSGIEIKIREVNGKEVIGDDLRQLIVIEQQIRSGQSRKNTMHRALGQPEDAPDPTAPTHFSDTRNEYDSPDDALTEREKFTLRHMTHSKNQTELAEILGVSSGEVSEVVGSLKERLGCSDFIDLMVAGVALKAASVSHVTEGITSKLSRDDLDFAANFYHPDVAQRRAFREQNADAKLGQKHWGKIYGKLHVNGRQMAVLHLLRDEEINLQGPEVLKHLLRGAPTS